MRSADATLIRWCYAVLSSRCHVDSALEREVGAEVKSAADAHEVRAEVRQHGKGAQKKNEETLVERAILPPKEAG